MIEIAMNSQDWNEKMIQEQIIARGIDRPDIINALRNTPRHLFLPDNTPLEICYQDSPVPIGCGQTISQPYIVALMSKVIEPDPDCTVLEVGAGCGYQTAILARLFQFVYSLEIIEPLAELAKRNLKKIGIQNAKILHRDGNKGLPDYSPFDRILAAASPEKIPDQLIAQLAMPGILFMPEGKQNQYLVRIIKNESGEFKRDQTIPVRFVPMTGNERL